MLVGDNVIAISDDAWTLQGKPPLLLRRNPLARAPDLKHLQGWFSGKDTVTWLAKVYVNTDTLSDANVRKALIRSVMKSRQGIVANFGS